MPNTANNSRLTICELKKIGITTLASILRALKIRLSKNSGCLNLPPVNPKRSLSDEKIARIVSLIDRLILWLMFWKPGRCYYRSYAIATLLRQWGVPLVINFGCDNISGQLGRAKAHCWLTLEGAPFFEKEDCLVRFPIAVPSKNDDIRYWFGAD